MPLRLRIPAICTLAFAFMAGNAAAHPLWKHEIPVRAPILHMIKWERAQTWKFQDQMGEPRFPANFSERKTESIEHRLWVQQLWHQRRLEAKKRWARYFRSWEAQNRNIYLAIRAAGRYFGVSPSWLLNCARSEGIIGGVVLHSPNYAGAAGPFQFLSGTFYSYAPSAFRAGHVPRRYLYWSSYVGQAWTAAYMFSRGLSYHWYGTGCR